MIDCHIHLSRPEHEHPWVFEFIQSQFEGDIYEVAERVLTPAGIRSFLQEAELDLAIGLAEMCPITTGTCTNEYTAEFCRAANALPDPASGPRGRLLWFASINPYMENDLGQALEHCVRDLGAAGFKVYPVYQHHYVHEPRMYPLYAKAQELGVPMLVHTGSSIFKGARIKYGDPLHLDDVAIDFPDLTIWMAHSGRPFWYQQAFWLARRHPNVYLEVSGLPGKKLLEYFPDLERLALAGKVVYGSDWPGNPYIRRNIEAIQALPLRESTIEKVLGGNAARVLGLAA